jgi:hypothetical protein
MLCGARKGLWRHRAQLKMDQDCAMDEVSLTHRFKAFKDIHSFVQPVLSDGRMDHTSRAFLDDRIRNCLVLRQCISPYTFPQQSAQISLPAIRSRLQSVAL